LFLNLPIGRTANALYAANPPTPTTTGPRKPPARAATSVGKAACVLAPVRVIASYASATLPVVGAATGAAATGAATSSARLVPGRTAGDGKERQGEVRSERYGWEHSAPMRKLRGSESLISTARCCACPGVGVEAVEGSAVCGAKGVTPTLPGDQPSRRGVHAFNGPGDSACGHTPMSAVPSASTAARRPVLSPLAGTADATTPVWRRATRRAAATDTLVVWAFNIDVIP
jgi:hypothetical protein